VSSNLQSGQYFGTFQRGIVEKQYGMKLATINRWKKKKKKKEDRYCSPQVTGRGNSPVVDHDQMQQNSYDYCLLKIIYIKFCSSICAVPTLILQHLINYFIQARSSSLTIPYAYKASSEADIKTPILDVMKYWISDVMNRQLVSVQR
jgi:hypothetical protein